MQTTLSLNHLPLQPASMPRSPQHTPLNPASLHLINSFTKFQCFNLPPPANFTSSPLYLHDLYFFPPSQPPTYSSASLPYLHFPSMVLVPSLNLFSVSLPSLQSPSMVLSPSLIWHHCLHFLSSAPLEVFLSLDLFCFIVYLQFPLHVFSSFP